MELIKSVLPSSLSLDTFTNPVYSAYNSIWQIISLAFEWICSCCRRSEDVKESPLAKREITPQEDKSAEDKRKASHARLLTLIDQFSQSKEEISYATEIEELENLLVKVGRIPEIGTLVLTLCGRVHFVKGIVLRCPNLVQMAQVNFMLDHLDFEKIDVFNSFANIHQITFRYTHYRPLNDAEINFLRRAKKLKLEPLSWSDFFSAPKRVSYLPSFPNLTELSAMTDPDTADFFHLLTPTLTTLTLRDKRYLTDERLAKLVSGSPHLTYLSVEGSSLTDKSVEKLLELPLVHLNISDSKISFNGLCQILESIKAPCEVHWGGLGMRNETEEYTQRIEAILKKRDLKVKIRRSWNFEITISPNI